MPSSSDSAVTDCNSRLALRISVTPEFCDAKDVPSDAEAISVVGMFVCAVRNCPELAAFQPAIGWPGADAKEKNATPPSPLASTSGALINAETSVCGAVWTLTGDAVRSICCKQVLHGELFPLCPASPTNTVCAEVAAIRTGPELASPGTLPTLTPVPAAVSGSIKRSEERRVGKECRSRW